MMWMYKRVIFGVAKESSAGFPDLTRVEVATLVPLMLGALYVGIYPVPIMKLLQPFINVLLAPFAGGGTFDAAGTFH
jgi:NADH-quinone oxidoreductase subunit M